MGLLDVLNGMQNGPRGAKQPSSGGSGGGMSPTTMALIGLLAYKALQHFGSSQAAAPGAPKPAPGGTTTASPAGGGSLTDILGGILKDSTRGQGGTAGGAIGDILGKVMAGQSGARGGAGSPGGSLSDLIPGGLGGLLNSPAGGSILSGGLASVIKDLQNSGQGKTAQSWVSSGQNEEIEPDDLAKALGSDAIDAMVKHTGMSRDDLLENLSQQLPEVVNHLTPNGRLPTETEAARMV